MSPVCLTIYCLLLLKSVFPTATNPPTQIRSSRQQPDQLQQQQAEAKIISRIQQNNNEEIKKSDSMIQLLRPIPQAVLQNQVVTVQGRIPINISSYYMFRNKANPFIIKTNEEQLVTVTLAVRNNGTKQFRLYEQQIIIRDVNLHTNQNDHNRNQRLFHFQVVFQEEAIFQVVLGLAVNDYGWLRYSSSLLSVSNSYDVNNLASPLNNFNIKDSRVIFSKVRPTNFTIQVINNEIILKWLPQAQVTKITLTQYSSSITFVTKNWKNSLTVPLYTLTALTIASPIQNQLNNMNISLTHPSIPQPNKVIAYSISVVKQVKVCQHHYMYIDKIHLKQFYSNFGNKNMINVGDRYQVQGVCGDIGGVIIMDPTGDISDVSVWDRNGLKVGDKSEGSNNMGVQINETNKQNDDGWFKFHFIAEQEGVYILEINHRDGYAILNMPIYVGSTYPFFPDKVDISKSKLFSSSPPPPFKIQALLPNILSSLNTVRKKYNVPQLSLDSELSTIAFKHSLDMIDRNYISHVNPEGLNCKGRAQAEGYFWTIGENIAVQQDFQLLRFKLDRSPLHLRNTINPNWGRVGIGLARSQDNMYYLTQLYAPPIQYLTDSLIKQVKSQLISVLTKKPPFRPLTQSTIVSQSLQTQLNTVNRVEPGQQSEKQRLKQVIMEWGIRSASLLNISLRQETNNDYFEDLYNNPNVINKADRNFIAISVSLNKGNLSIFACLY